jgi:hypothetical protein
MVAQIIDSSAGAPRKIQTLTVPTAEKTKNQSNAVLPLNQAHAGLNAVWKAYFTGQAMQDNLPPVLPKNLTNRVNVPWAPPDGHEFNDDLFRIYFQHMNGFSRVNGTLPSWVSIMDFLSGLHVSLFAFTEPNLQWDGTLVRFAKEQQQRFFRNGQLLTSESNLHFPTSYKPGGMCIGINGKLATRVTDQGTDPSGQGRWSYMTLSRRSSIYVMFISAYQVC